MQNHRIWATVDLNALRKNFEYVCSRAPGMNVTGIVKANAYGMGVHPVAETLKQAGCSRFGVATCKEGLELLKYGLPVQLLGAVPDFELPDVVKNGIVTGITDYETAERFSAEAVRQNRTMECHFKLDTGMGRLGILYYDAPELIRAVSKLPGLDCSGIYSHFPQVGSPLAAEQVKRFKQVLNDVENDGIRFRHIHMANSDAIESLDEVLGAPFNGVRAGLILHKNVLTLQATLGAVRKMPAGYSIGYNQTHVLKSDTTVGTVCAGYADGLPLALSNRGMTICNGEKCPVIGRVSMDYTTIDLSSCPDAKAGDVVTLISPDVPASAWAELKGSHEYDIFCSISQRVPRIYTGT